jgi:hypothetical protein
MKNVYYETESAQGYNPNETARDVNPSVTFCTKAFNPESARFEDPDDACEVAGG